MLTIVMCRGSRGLDVARLGLYKPWRALDRQTRCLGSTSCIDMVLLFLGVLLARDEFCIQTG